MTLALGLISALLAVAAVVLAVRLGRARAELRQLERGLEKTEAELAAARSARLGIIDAVAHELRTPLSAILGHQELLAEGLYGQLEERAQGAVVRIGDSSRQLLHLIDGVLDLARVELGALELQIEPTDSRELVEGAARYARALSGDRGGEMEVALPDRFPSFVTDPRRAERLIHLAVTGAVRATGSRPLSLRARWEEGPTLLFELSGTSLDPDAAPEDGVGRPDPGEAALDELHRAMPRPVVGEGTHGPEAPGRSWLRLTVARTLARRLGGELHVQEEGETTRVSIRLPALEPGAPPSAGEPEQ